MTQQIAATGAWSCHREFSVIAGIATALLVLCVAIEDAMGTEPLGGARGAAINAFVGAATRTATAANASRIAWAAVRTRGRFFAAKSSQPRLVI
jgi:hypothetical protein